MRGDAAVAVTNADIVDTAVKVKVAELVEVAVGEPTEVTENAAVFVDVSV